jgi:hypothetical protein
MRCSKWFGVATYGLHDCKDFNLHVSSENSVANSSGLIEVSVAHATSGEDLRLQLD